MVNFDDGKGVEFYIDSDGTAFTANERGLSGQRVWLDDIGWSDYEPGFNPSVVRKVTEQECRDWIEQDKTGPEPDSTADESAVQKPSMSDDDWDELEKLP